MIFVYCLPLAEKCVIKIKSKVKNHAVSSAFLTFSLFLIENTQASERQATYQNQIKEKKEMKAEMRQKNYIRSSSIQSKTQNRFLRPSKEKGTNMEYQDFLNLSAYGNEQWNGSFTQEEVAENAETYYSDFLFSKKTGKTTEIITELLNLLEEDGEEQASEWKTRIEKELNL